MSWQEGVFSPLAELVARSMCLCSAHGHPSTAEERLTRMAARVAEMEAEAQYARRDKDSASDFAAASQARGLPRKEVLHP